MSERPDQTLTNEQIANWRSELEREQADAHWAEETVQWSAHRSLAVGQALLELLSASLDWRIPLKEFQTTFDKRTLSEWDIMVLKGLSGAMFLRTLVQGVPDQDQVDAKLRQALPLPHSPHDGVAKMAALVAFVDSLTASDAVADANVQAEHIPFVSSALKQLQERESWLVYYWSMRSVCERQRVYRKAHGTVAGDYLTFPVTRQRKEINQVVAAFGTKHVTSAYAGRLKVNYLVVIAPNRNKRSCNFETEINLDRMRDVFMYFSERAELAGDGSPAHLQGSCGRRG